MHMGVFMGTRSLLEGKGCEEGGVMQESGPIEGFCINPPRSPGLPRSLPALCKFIGDLDMACCEEVDCITRSRCRFDS